ncbi:hypothetical protein ATANTOWER_005402 [Ataeniobius toweri]|uniref:Uncharacterized protein n=1 Tax=Ataeniobius toweri TaxID=208326 RepID=A0ABU7CC78_9TELE|nr:hypothetical protein [Ataeniobius toweri]
MDNTSIITQVANPKEEESLSSSQDKGKPCRNDQWRGLCSILWRFIIFCVFCCLHGDNLCKPVALCAKRNLRTAITKQFRRKTLHCLDEAGKHHPQKPASIPATTGCTL